LASRRLGGFSSTPDSTTVEFETHNFRAVRGPSHLYFEHGAQLSYSDRGRPRALKDFILGEVNENSQTVEALKQKYREAERERRFEDASQLFAQIARRLWPTSATLKLVGGHGAHVLVRLARPDRRTPER
jgi:hypothetical protein